jgi:hypothetical protein
MTPILPPFTAVEGQCLPAAVAVLFGTPETLDVFQPKRFGYLLTELGRMLPEGLWFDVIYSDKDRKSGAASALSAASTLSERFMMAFFVQHEHHVVLYLIDSTGNNIYGFDLLRERAAKVSQDAFLRSKITAVATIVQPHSNSFFGIDASSVPHLFNRK